MRTGPPGICQNVEESPGFQWQGRVGHFDIVSGLDAAGVGKKCVGRE